MSFITVTLITFYNKIGIRYTLNNRKFNQSFVLFLTLFLTGWSSFFGLGHGSFEVELRKSISSINGLVHLKTAEVLSSQSVVYFFKSKAIGKVQ